MNRQLIAHGLKENACLNELQNGIGDSIGEGSSVG